MRVLIAEDNRVVAGTLAGLIGASDHQVVEMVGSGLEAIHAYDRLKPDVVVMDYLMAGLNGVTACRNIVAKDPAARVVIVSGALGPQDLAVTRCGACAILQKPIRLAELKQAIELAAPAASA
ncbi:MAG TPA: response regulator transcription factor [Chthoniobacterales bacterium]|jgi:DNA-binding NarL/FixJ family response regulator